MLKFYDTTNSLGFEPLGDEGVCAITSALKENSTLIDLSYVMIELYSHSNAAHTHMHIQNVYRFYAMATG